MSDELAAAMGIGGGLLGGGGVIFSLLKWSGSRNIDALDGTIKALGETIGKLTDELQKLREAHIGLAKDVGALQEGQRALTARIDGQGTFWHQQFEEVRSRLPRSKR